MNPPKLAKTLVIVFTVLTAVSVAGLYYAHQLPLIEIQAISLCIFQHNGTYSYLAQLKPNTIYNKTALAPEEGRLYTAILDTVNLTFTYTFVCSPAPNKTDIGHQILIQLESPGRWQKNFSSVEAHELFKLSSSLNFTLEVNSTRMTELFDSIDKETGTNSTAYNVNIRPEIRVATNIVTIAQNVTFTPELAIKFRTDAENGSYISMGNLTKSGEGEVVEAEEIPLTWVQWLRTGSYVATAATATILVVAVLLFLKHRAPPSPKKAPITKMTAPYKELVAETTHRPPETETTIDMNTLQDLAKIAETLIKPMLHTVDGKEHTFYVLDNKTKYQFKTESESKE